MPPALGPRPRFIVERLPRQRAVGLKYPLRPRLRGLHEVGPLGATVADPFGLCQLRTELTGSTRLTVVPRTEQLWGQPAGAGLGTGEDGTIRLATGQGENDVVVRPYRQGDDLRKVHWRSTARRDEIMVRLEERPWRGGTTVLLDNRASAHHGSGGASSLEWAVSMAASACLHLRRSGHRVRLVSEQGAVLAEAPAEGGGGYDHAVLDALAALQPGHHRDAAPGLDPAAGQELIAILGTVSSDAIAELTHYRQPSARSLAVLLDAPSFERDVTAPRQRAAATEESAAMLRAVGWGVVVAGPDTGFAEAWAELCRAARHRGTVVEGTP